MRVTFEKKTKSFRQLAIVLIIAIGLGAPMLHIAEDVSAATIYTVDDSGGADYTTIQAAIDAASSGDTIQVAAGTYYETITVYKTLTIVGNDASDTIIDGNGTGDIVTITANSVDFSGFNVTQAGPGSNAGISVTSDDNKIYACIIYESHDYGIDLISADGNEISNNTIYDYDDAGIRLYDSDSNDLILNMFYQENESMVSLRGIWLESDDFSNTLSENTANDNHWFGIQVGSSDSNIIMDNICDNNDRRGISMYWSDSNVIKRNSCSVNKDVGIRLHDSDLNAVENNTCNGNTGYPNSGYGIILDDGCDSNTLIHNDVKNNNISGIWLYDDCDENSITYCSIELHNTNYGINISYNSDSNSIDHNDIKTNNGGNPGHQGYDDDSNSWDDGSTGNFWEDWEYNSGYNSTYVIDGGSSADNNPQSDPVDGAGVQN